MSIGNVMNPEEPVSKKMQRMQISVSKVKGGIENLNVDNRNHQAKEKSIFKEAKSFGNQVNSRSLIGE